MLAKVCFDDSITASRKSVWHCPHVKMVEKPIFEHRPSKVLLAPTDKSSPELLIWCLQWSDYLDRSEYALSWCHIKFLINSMFLFPGEFSLFWRERMIILLADRNSTINHFRKAIFFRGIGDANVSFRLSFTASKLNVLKRSSAKSCRKYLVGLQNLNCTFFIGVASLI